MPVPRSVAFAVVTALLPVAGCVETPPGPLPQATPSWSCTPVAGGTPYACYEHQYQQTSAQNKLYEEAEAVFRRFNAEDERIYRAGGVDAATSTITATLTGSLLEATLSNYADLKRTGTRMIDGEFAVVSIARLTESKDGSVAALQVCLDVSEVQMRTGSKGPYRLGKDTIEVLYFSQTDTSLKIGAASNRWVKSC